MTEKLEKPFPIFIFLRGEGYLRYDFFYATLFPEDFMLVDCWETVDKRGLEKPVDMEGRYLCL